MKKSPLPENTGSYTFENQPKQQKQLLSFSAALFFAFNLFLFGPLEMFISNLKSIPIKSITTVLAACVPVFIIVFAALLILFLSSKGKLHIISVTAVFGVGLAFYLQGNFLQIGAAVLDGSRPNAGILKIIINIVIWLVIIAFPWLVYFKCGDIYSKVITGVSLAICLIELITIFGVMIQQANEDWNTAYAFMETDNRVKFCSTEDMFTYSKDKNFIIILADEYDSFCFDSAIETEPECVAGFDGFTYYRNTLGMYERTTHAIPYLFCGMKNYEVDNGMDHDPAFFEALRNNGYKTNIYGVTDVFTEKINAEYSENFVVKELSFGSYIQVGKTLYKLVMYKYSPVVFKSFFWMYSVDIDKEIGGSTDVPVYSPDDLDFYESLGNDITLIDQPCFKFFYLNGLHLPRDIQADLTRNYKYTIKGDEQAIAVNKIMSRYFDVLRENGIYDNSEIILLADHGIKIHDDGRYPLLTVKRRGDTGKGLRISEAPVSQADIFPSVIAIAEGNSDIAPLFNIAEDEERERFFDYTDEYITEHVKGGPLGISVLITDNE